MNISFTVPGQPVAKGRPKFARRGNFVTAYTPAKTVAYESMVKVLASEAMQGQEPSGAPMELIISLVMQIPVSWNGKRRAKCESGLIRATKKPDADNVLKAIKDGCNGIVWRDDAQVVKLEVSKNYGDRPRAIVSICEAEGESA